ncbi:ribose-phosphate pyrophosphokinase [Ensifer sp. ENS12]|nr:ribose-phosphate pyrophosphokinase [Ensifer sp. ENS12]
MLSGFRSERRPDFDWNPVRLIPGIRTEAIANHLDLSFTDCTVKRFADQEIHVQLHENVRGEDVYVLQSTSAPADGNLMELLLLADTLRRSSARRITAVIPYFGYARQDRRATGRTPISAKLVANMIAAAGVNRVITVDLHTDQIQGFFDIPTDNLYSAPVMTRDIEQHYDIENLMVVSPDVGGVARARAIAKRIGTDLAIVDKRRPRADVSEVMNIIGDVSGKRCLLVDDIVDSGGTLINAAEALLMSGAKDVSTYITHGVLSEGACERIGASQLKELVVTDSIHETEEQRETPNIRRITIAPLIGEALARTAREQSVSSLFN